MRRILLSITMVMLVAACATQSEVLQPESLTLIAHDSFVEGVTTDTFAGFTASSGIEVNVIAGGDAGAMVNQLVLTRDNPLADVAFGVDDTFLSRAIDEEIFIEHGALSVSNLLADLRPGNKLVAPIDFGDVCINYDKGWFTESGLAVPTTVDQLRDPTYASQLTVEHPATSSPGLAFMLATIAEYGEDFWLDFWADLRAGGVNVVSDWNTAYYSDFAPYGGDSAMVVSYASSPPAEVIFAEEPIDEAPTGVIEAGCYRQIEYAGILAGTRFPEAAGELINYMLSVEFQEKIPLTWFVFPANENAALPQVFIDNTTIPTDPAILDSSDIAENRDRWIAQWVAVMEG